MKKIAFLVTLFLVAAPHAWTQTPPPGSVKAKLYDAAGNAITSTGGKLDVAVTGTTTVSGSVSVSNFPATQAVTGTFWQGTQPVSGSFFQATQPVSLLSVPLASGASTATLQGIGNASLASILSALQGTIAVSGTFWQATQPVSGPLTDAQLRASAVPVSGTFFQATQPVSGSLGRSWNLGFLTDFVDVSGSSVSISNFPATQPVSGSVSVSNFPANPATSTLQTTGNTSLGTIATNTTNISAKLPATLGQKVMTGSLSMTLASDQTAGVFATGAKQDTGNNLLTTINTSALELPNISAAVGANNAGSPQSSFAMGGTDAAVIQPIGAEVHSGFWHAKTADYFGGLINAKTPALGAALAAASTPVNIASDQVVPVSISGTVTVSGGLTDTQLRASAVPVTANAGTNLNTSALALSATQTSGAQKTQVVDGSGNVQPSGDIAARSIKVDASATTQPVSGTVTANAGTNLNTSALALSATQTSGAQKTQVVDGSGNVMPSGDVATRGVFSKLTDGTNSGTIKAASTAAAGTDTAVVVAVSPNNSVAVTQATAANLNATVVGTAGAALATSGNQTSQITQETTTATNTGTIASAIGSDGAAAPTKSIQVGGFDGTNQQALNVDGSGNLLPDLYFTGAATQTATVNNIIPAVSGATATDALSYKSGSVQVVSTGTGGTFIFEGSNDNTSFQTMPVYSQLILTGTPIVAAITATSSNLGYIFPVNFRYIRLRIATTITGGSIQAFTKLTQTPFTPAVFQVAQATAANLNMTAQAVQSGTWNVGITSPTATTDIASAAITTTTTTAAITPATTFSQQFSLNVTAASGTNPTMDVVLQESPDTGTSWFDVYHFPRFTGVFSFKTPFIRINGNRLRYVQTISGTTPSFTRVLTRLSSPMNSETVRVFRDRTINPTVTNSASPAWDAQGCTVGSIYVNTGGSNVSPSQYALYCSMDGVSAWGACSSTLSVAAGGNGFLGSISGPFYYVRIQVPTGVALSSLNEGVFNCVGN